MRIFHIHGGGVQELAALPARMPAQGFVWIACSRPVFQARLADIQGSLQALAGLQLVDLHVSDLLNAQLPSHFDYTSQYDLLVFRRLASAQGHAAAAPQDGPAPAGKRRGPPVLRRIDTSPVGFALFDQLLLTVHPDDCAVRNAYAARLLAALPGASPAEGRSSPLPGARLPGSPADLMLRVIHLMVDGYLDLRRELTRQLDHWQTELLKPRARGVNWASLLQARLALHALDEICEGQRAALQDWIETLETWALPDSPAGLRELDLLKVRSRDVLEHIERVVRHVRRLEQSTETAVQIHFSVQSQRTNDTMRTLTALTAVFLPLNLMAGIFGMNFEFLPLTDKANGFWWALAAMLFIALALLLLFWRKRYLARSGR
ncbi:CorA family divalent cation transporter [Verminephrobacter eiseniae]|uniref:Mg2+ transporter protein, CorA family protein n=1 Tax=Verminephrobacter eiseniae (strain EF01-2) TaxID=391735 RepID=A1WEX0_VEREI|nr:CorA family divalent cation transporter [Verminephrobacter eiseniae]ABM56177.1 Mg2+ transporter protein, CorA family protein [Verminephrobacter eiseniae EF01-2]MCW5286548.1 magnesium transporter CorA [Verminephrobacter eiseniae]MCW5304847.1 magnesium transporter CorA [Verminephrobacter eiseniae]MCW8182410.1 magnesium transporter CorA [Verminephrobacter eiseniae]MCW8190017.1 magnesium transporter CorA [Verminephrobacter eiseniae]